MTVDLLSRARAAEASQEETVAVPEWPDENGEPTAMRIRPVVAQRLFELQSVEAKVGDMADARVSVEAQWLAEGIVDPPVDHHQACELLRLSAAPTLRLLGLIKLKSFMGSGAVEFAKATLAANSPATRLLVGFHDRAQKGGVDFLKALREVVAEAEDGQQAATLQELEALIGQSFERLVGEGKKDSSPEAAMTA